MRPSVCFLAIWAETIGTSADSTSYRGKSHRCRARGRQPTAPASACESATVIACNRACASAKRGRSSQKSCAAGSPPRAGRCAAARSVPDRRTARRWCRGTCSGGRACSIGQAIDLMLPGAGAASCGGQTTNPCGIESPGGWLAARRPALTADSIGCHELRSRRKLVSSRQLLASCVICACLAKFALLASTFRNDVVSYAARGNVTSLANMWHGRLRPASVRSRPPASENRRIVRRYRWQFADDCACKPRLPIACAEVLILPQCSTVADPMTGGFSWLSELTRR